MVRRVQPKATGPGEMLELLPERRYHAFATGREDATTLQRDGDAARTRRSKTS